MGYLYKNRHWAAMLLFVAAAYNLYFIYLEQSVHLKDLIYPDLLIFCVVLITVGIDAAQYYMKKRKKDELLKVDMVIFQQFDSDDMYLDVARHDVQVLEQQLHDQFAYNCDLQDYIAKWCHEIKLPLSAVLLMNEKISDAALRTSQKEQLEIIRQRLNGALLGCKVQSSLFDLQIRATDLADCVKTAIHNNQYFLIQKQFELSIQVEPVKVYTDKSWLVYVLDQLIQNAVKYASENRSLTIWSRQDKGETQLIVKDLGEGIKDCDLRRIFERGFTGSSYHNGRYKSTGMGLYLARQIVERLGHDLAVESEYGKYTQFVIRIYETKKWDES
ncbi:MAG: HAMP domain-containing histidine kinase [Eubacterium sp.]|nr:HAMP domain-containing histidine kinase [Eubacterium sp.]MCI8920152.1 HAMP domain-containing histidine kinase [Eubacterium sp.]